MSKVKIDREYVYEDMSEENEHIAQKHREWCDEYDDEDDEFDDYRFKKTQARRRRELDY